MLQPLTAQESSAAVDLTREFDPGGAAEKLSVCRMESARRGAGGLLALAAVFTPVHCDQNKRRDDEWPSRDFLPSIP